jgi:hypothetical protein
MDGGAFVDELTIIEAQPLASADCLFGECVHRGTCRGQHVEDVDRRGANFLQVGFDPLQDGVCLTHDARNVRLLSQEEHEQDFDRDESSSNLNAYVVGVRHRHHRHLLDRAIECALGGEEVARP